MKVCIIGAGTWGTALGKCLSKNCEVYLYTKFLEECESLKATRVHKNLKGMIIPDSVVISNDLKDSINNSEFIIFAVPSIYLRDSISEAKQYINDSQILINVAKGIEKDTLFMMSDIIKDVCPNNEVVVLSGPTHAEEVAIDLPTTIISACDNLVYAKAVADLFVGTCIRAYTNSDVLGVELSGALKNIVALASGISTGLGNGDNAKAAIITRGIVEISRLGKLMGCDQSTFNGLAGIGDLIVTATSIHSRNNKCGYLLGQGKTLDEAKKEVGMVVEGINALEAAKTLADKYDVYMPIVNGTYQIVYNNVDPKIVLDELMNRPTKHEVDK